MENWEHYTDLIYEDKNLLVFRKTHAYNPNWPNDPEHRVKTCEYVISDGYVRTIIGEDNAKALLEVLKGEFENEA